MSATTPKGFVCECGREIAFPAYVFAHWDDALNHECPDCKRAWMVFRGKATLLKNGVVGVG